MEAARRLIERGLALAGEGKDRFPLACAYGDVQRDLGATAESIAAFEEAGVTDLNITPVSDDPAATVAQVREWVS